MDIPTFLKGTMEENWDYFEQTQQTLLEGVGPNGFQISQLTQAQINQITSQNYLPIQPAGQMFFNTTIQEWQGIWIPAVYQSSNAVVVTFSTSGYTAFPWTVVTTNTLMGVNNGYFTSSGGTLLMTLPTVVAVGSTIRISNIAGNFRIVQSASPLQSINFGDDTTTPGAGGSVTSMDVGDTVELVCYAANTGFQVLSSMGNFVIV